MQLAVQQTQRMEEICVTENQALRQRLREYEAAAAVVVEAAAKGESPCHRPSHWPSPRVYSLSHRFIGPAPEYIP
jgi:hypothetical protein